METLFWIDSHVLAFAHIGGMRFGGDSPALSGEKLLLFFHESLDFFLGGFRRLGYPHMLVS